MLGVVLGPTAQFRPMDPGPTNHCQFCAALAIFTAAKDLLGTGMQPSAGRAWKRQTNTVGGVLVGTETTAVVSVVVGRICSVVLWGQMLGRPHRSLRAVGHVDPLEQATAVRLHGLLADSELATDLLVALATYDEPQDLPLALRQ